MTVMAHLMFLLLVMWVGVTVSTVVDLQKRIYGGKDCKATERLYHIRLSAYSDGKCGHCGGSLIKNQWVLTAAHCRSRPMYAVVGVHQGTKQVMKIEEKHIVPHPHDDIMLLKLPVVSTITPVALPACKKDTNRNIIDEHKIQDVVQVAGHGGYAHDSDGYIIPDEPPNLQCADMNVDKCDDPAVDKCYSKKPFAPQQNRMCYKNPHLGTRGGDSGGGVIFKDKIYAVHIAGTDGFPCTPNDFALSLKVCSYIDWINQNAK